MCNDHTQNNRPANTTLVPLLNGVPCSLIKTALSALPPYGGAVASILGDYINGRRFKSLEDTINFIKIRLTHMESRINEEELENNKNHTVELFQNCMIIAASTVNEDKLKILAAIVVNSLLATSDSERISFSELDLFSRCVDNISGDSIQVLCALYKAAKPSEHKRHAGLLHHVSASDVMSNLSQDVDIHLCRSLLKELSNCHLAELSSNTGARGPDQAYASNNIWLTPQGESFTERLIHVWENTNNQEL